MGSESEGESVSESRGESENESPTQRIGWLGAIYQGGASGRTWMGYVMDVPTPEAAATGQGDVFTAPPAADGSVEEVVGVFDTGAAARLAVLEALKRKWRESPQYLAAHSALSVPIKPTKQTGPRAARKRRRSA